MVWASVLTLLVFVTTTAAFVPPQHSPTTASSLKAALVDDLKPSEQSVYKFLSTLQSSAYSFRTIVVGGGAILESTQASLGSVIKVNESPKTGDLLCTLATDDQSFEMHVKLNQVGKIALVEKTTPNKTMRIIRMLQADGGSICSLILTDSSDEAASWFGALKEEYGDEFEP